MTRVPSLRRLWLMYKRAVLVEGLGRTKRDHLQVLVQNAFYNRARSAYKVMGYLLDQGDYEQLRKLIARQAQQVQAIQGLRPKARRH
jgi:hypothetical protein